MKILMISDYFPPEIGSASFLFYELAKRLIEKGVKVSVVTGFPRYNINKDNLKIKYRRRILLKEEKEGIQIIRVKTLDLSRRINILRGLNQFITSLCYFFGGLFVKDYTHILVYSPPLPLGITSWLLGKLKRKKTIFNAQDLFPKSAIDLGALNNKELVVFLNWLEKFIYMKNKQIVVHSSGNKEHVKKVTDKKAKVEIIPNWVNTEEIKPGSKINEFGRKYRITDKFVVSFAGVLGESQDLDIILDAAKVLREHRNIIFILVGDGRKKQRLLRRKVEEGISNLSILPMQPKDRYPLVLNSSDIGLVTLKRSVKTPVVPSKILSLMAAGVPIVASLPMQGDAPKIIQEAKAGVCVEAENREKFAESILKIYNDISLREYFRSNGRVFAERNFSLEYCADEYIRLFNSV